MYELLFRMNVYKSMLSWISVDVDQSRARQQSASFIS